MNEPLYLPLSRYRSRWLHLYPPREEMDDPNAWPQNDDDEQALYESLPRDHHYMTLHRVSEVRWEDEELGDMIHGEGVTVCGRRGWLSMPGLMERSNTTGVPRCKECCAGSGVPEGFGSPRNGMIPEVMGDYDDTDQEGWTVVT